MTDESNLPEPFKFLSPDIFRLTNIFYPYATEKMLDVARRNVRFVHYTTAETAMKIISSQEVWLRKSSVMNDFSEIEYGFGCLDRAFKAQRDRFARLFDGMFPGFSDKLLERFNGWLPHFRTDTFIACFSEHDDTEDLYGRLSMWRAYGQPNGTALVINNGPFLRPTDALKAYTNPVAYLTPTQFDAEFDRLLVNIERDRDFVHRLEEDKVLNNIFAAFRTATLCTKHPGFHEEREWRVIYSPAYAKSDRILAETVTIGGVPQPICKIPLHDIPDEGLTGLEIPTLIDRIIIGPTEYPLVMRDAFLDALTRAGAKDAIQRIIVSDIPLRR